MMNRRGGGKKGGGGGRKFQNSPNKKTADANVGQNVLSCPACNFSCSSIPNLRIHFQQTGHDQARGDKLHSDLQAPAGPEADDTAGVIPDHIRRSVLRLKDYTLRADREPIIGLQYILEYRVQAAPEQPCTTRYFCQLCQVDCELIAMMEHLSCHRHRKLYLIKEFPYVLRAPSNAKENRAQFMRRMAMEIEQEEKKKMYTMDPITRTAPIKAADVKQSKVKTRWNYEGDRQRRMRKALEYLETFEIDNDTEASTVTRLTEKLIAELKYHSDKLKQEALFPAKVARAKDVALSIMQNAPRKQMAPVNQKNPAQNAPPTSNKPPQTINKAPPMSNKPPPTFNKTPATISKPPQMFNKDPATISKPPQMFNKDPATISKPPQMFNKASPTINNPPSTINNPPSTINNPPSTFNKPPQTFNNPQPPQTFNKPPPAFTNPPPTFSQPPPTFSQPPPTFNNGPPQNITMGTPSGPPPPIPENPSWTPNATFPQMAYNSGNQAMAMANPAPQAEQPNEEDNKFVKKLKLLLSVLQQNSASTDGAQVNSKLVMLKSLLLNKAGSTPANQLPMQMGSMMPGMASADHVALYQQLQIMASQNPASMAQFGPNIMMQMASMVQNTVPMANTQVDPNSMLQVAAQLQNNQMNANSLLPVSQYGNMNPVMQMDPNAYQNQFVGQQQGFPNTFQSNQGYGYEGQMAGDNTMRPYADVPAKPAPYTRVTLSPTKQRPELDRFHDDHDLRRDVRSFDVRPSYGERRLLDEPGWAEKDRDMHYSKRVRLDSDLRSLHSAERGRHYPDEGQAAEPNTPNLSVDLLKRIRGKDLFTASAILSEYAENPSSR